MLPAKQSASNPGERAVAFTHNGTNVLFDDNRLVCLNDVWKAFGSIEKRDPRRWLQLDSTKSLASALARKLDVGNPDIIRTSRIRGAAGTWAHYKLAIAYSEYVSEEAHLYVIQAFREWAEEQADPSLKVERAALAYQRQGKELDWIERRFRGIVARNALTSTMADHNCKVNGPNDNPFAEGTRSISLAVLGKTPKEIRAEKGLAKSARTRDHLEVDDLISIEWAEIQARKRMKVTAADGNTECVDACRQAARAVRVALDLMAAPA